MCWTRSLFMVTSIALYMKNAFSSKYNRLWEGKFIFAFAKQLNALGKMCFWGLLSDDKAKLLEKLQGTHQAKVYLHYQGCENL